VSIRADRAFFKAQGLIQGKVSADGAVDDSFVAEAVK
jgi:hypothetical protein